MRNRLYLAQHTVGAVAGLKERALDGRAEGSSKGPENDEDNGPNAPRDLFIR